MTTTTHRKNRDLLITAIAKGIETVEAFYERQHPTEGPVIEHVETCNDTIDVLVLGEHWTISVKRPRP